MWSLLFVAVILLKSKFAAIIQSVRLISQHNKTQTRCPGSSTTRPKPNRKGMKNVIEWYNNIILSFKGATDFFNGIWHSKDSLFHQQNNWQRTWTLNAATVTEYLRFPIDTSSACTAQEDRRNTENLKDLRRITDTHCPALTSSSIPPDDGKKGSRFFADKHKLGFNKQ